MIKIILPAAIKQIAGVLEDIEIEAGNVAEAVDKALEKYPELRSSLYDSRSNFKKYIRLYLNETMLEATGYAQVLLEAGDVISIIIPVSGG